jgi:predicted nucleic acid-binding protein
VKRLFIDSDILLDLSLRRNPFYIPALNLLNLCYQSSSVEAATSSIAFINVSYFLKKLAPATKTEALKRIRTVVSIIEVRQETIDFALNSNFSDFEDAVQYYAALSGKTNVIITRNIKDYKQSTIPVLTAEQFLRTL